MKICIPTSEGKLCSHFGHCDSFTIAEIDENTKEILSIEEKIPEDGISCHSAMWIGEQGVKLVLAGGMGARPLMMFAQAGIKVIPGCPELEIKELLTKFMANSLTTGENACGGEEHDHSHCHNHGGHHCHH